MPRKSVAVVGIGLGLEDNIIIHSVNNILILLSMINSVNVKNNRYVVHVFLRFAICNLLLLLFFTLTMFVIDSRIRILLKLCIIIFFMKYPLTLILSQPTRVFLEGIFPSHWQCLYYRMFIFSIISSSSLLSLLCSFLLYFLNAIQLLYIILYQVIILLIFI